MRAWHRRIALLTLIPFTVILATGVILQIKRWIPGIQPESKKSLALSSTPSTLQTLPQLFTTAASVPEAEIGSWSDIHMIDIRPELGVARVRAQNDIEVQIDLHDGRILHSGKRLTGTLIEIHEGAFFGQWIRNGIFLPTAVLSLFFILSGVFLLKTYYLRR